jgi:integrating conjugative element protein (TIGR03761 family)
VYSLSAERTRLAHLIESPNPSPADPDYPAYLVYLERVESLDQEKATHRARGGADALVSDREAAAINRLTGLVPEDAEYMVVHTKEAYRAFTGRARDPEGNYERIVGGRKAAASLKSLWYLTGNDNPYADWALVSITDQLEEADQKFDAEIAKVEVALKKREKLGLRYSILRSKEPQNVELGFRSPYGWKIAELLVRYDYLVRMLKTLNTRAILTDAKTQKAIMDHTRLVRRLFLAPLRFEAVLLKEDVAALSRRDFLQEADAEARKRVGQIQGVFGRVPTDIMTGSVSPQHGKRRAVLTPDEMRQLRTLQAVPIDAEDDGAERGLL